MNDVANDVALARRLVIGRGVLASFLLPAYWLRAAAAAAAEQSRAKPRIPAVRPAPDRAVPRPLVVLDPG